MSSATSGLIDGETSVVLRAMGLKMSHGAPKDVDGEPWKEESTGRIELLKDLI